jgi:enoyl-CoA hydratase
MSKHVFYLVDKKPPVAWVFLNRPEKKNTMGPDAWTRTRPAVPNGIPA